MELKIIKKADDVSLGVKVNRISVGGDDNNLYIVYRGDLRDIQRMLKTAAEKMAALTVEPPVSADEGKQYA